MFNMSLKTVMQKVMIAKKIKIKTAIAVALVCLSAGTAMAGLYYYGYRSIGSFNPFSWKKNSPVAKNENKNNNIQAASLIGTISGTCQVCGGKTYCKCECPKKK